jgi:hypothetical protein
VSAAGRREELEAALWRVTGSTPGTAVALVDAALRAADVYADAARGELIARMTGAASVRLTLAAAEAARRAALWAP